MEKTECKVISVALRRESLLRRNKIAAVVLVAVVCGGCLILNAHIAVLIMR